MTTTTATAPKTRIPVPAYMPLPVYDEKHTANITRAADGGSWSALAEFGARAALPAARRAWQLINWMIERGDTPHPAFVKSRIDTLMWCATQYDTRDAYAQYYVRDEAWRAYNTSGLRGLLAVAERVGNRAKSIARPIG